MVNRNPVREARRRSKSPKPTSEVGYCLRETRECLGVGAGAPDAISAWEAAKHKHPETDPRKIPRGVPVFWGGSEHGHVALSSGFGGKCFSTDIRRAGYFDQVPIAEIEEKWGLKLLGWTEDLNGVRVWSPPRAREAAPETAPARPRPAKKAAAKKATAKKGQS